MSVPDTCWRAPRARPIHMAAHVRPDGAVSPLCASRPRALALGRASWTLRPTAVTCRRCLARLGKGEGV
jgi:hypothetical protein